MSERAEDRAAYETWSAAELKAEAKRLGLPVRGTKATLIERLLDVPAEGDEPAEADEATAAPGEVGGPTPIVPEFAPGGSLAAPHVSSRGRGPAIASGVDEAPTTGAYVPNDDEAAERKAIARAESDAALAERG